MAAKGPQRIHNLAVICTIAFLHTPVLISRSAYRLLSQVKLFFFWELHFIVMQAIKLNKQTNTSQGRNPDSRICADVADSAFGAQEASKGCRNPSAV